MKLLAKPTGRSISIGRLQNALSCDLLLGIGESGFTGSRQVSTEQRYERAEKDLFARLEGVGRNIENRVTGNDSNRLKDQDLKPKARRPPATAQPNATKLSPHPWQLPAPTKPKSVDAPPPNAAKAHTPAQPSPQAKAQPRLKRPTQAVIGAERAKSGPAR